MINAAHKISVVMPVFNCEKYIKQAIDSILAQNFSDFEFIIINDGSIDSSLDIIKSFHDARIVIINQPNQGVAAALNVGINIATGKYIARMDADDVSMTERLEQQFKFLEMHSSCVAIGTNAEIIDRDGQYIYTSNQPITWNQIKKILPNTPFFHSSTMFLKTVAIQCGCYMKEMITAQDVILFNQMASVGELCNMEDVLIKYRILPSAMSLRTEREEKEVARIVREIISSQRVSDEHIIYMRKLKRKSRWMELSVYYMRIGKMYLEKNFNRKRAIANFLKSLIFNPCNFKSWFNLVLSVLPKFIIHDWKRSRGAVCEY